MWHFCRTTAMLLKAGILLPQIMNIVVGTVRNRVIRGALMEVEERLVQGEGLSRPMAANKLFPRLLVEMVAVGEKTGDLESMLDSIANLYERRVEQRITALTMMVEPALTLAVGLVVGFLAVSIITPIFSLVGQLQ